MMPAVSLILRQLRTWSPLKAQSEIALKAKPPRKNDVCSKHTVRKDIARKVAQGARKAEGRE